MCLWWTNTDWTPTPCHPIRMVWVVGSFSSVGLALYWLLGLFSWLSGILMKVGSRRITPGLSRERLLVVPEWANRPPDASRPMRCWCHSYATESVLIPQWTRLAGRLHRGIKKFLLGLNHPTFQTPTHWIHPALQLPTPGDYQPSKRLPYLLDAYPSLRCRPST